jgi:hypothetical protein
VDTVDRAEDERYRDASGDELPPHLSTEQGPAAGCAAPDADSTRGAPPRPGRFRAPAAIGCASRSHGWRRSTESSARQNAASQAYRGRGVMKDGGASGATEALPATRDAGPERSSHGPGRRNIKTPRGYIAARVHAGKGMIEPAFAQTKFIRRIDRVLTPRKIGVRSEWRLITATHNQLKLYRHEVAPAAPGTDARPQPTPPIIRMDPGERSPASAGLIRNSHAGGCCRMPAEPAGPVKGRLRKTPGRPPHAAGRSRCRPVAPLWHLFLRPRRRLRRGDFMPQPSRIAAIRG